MNKKYLAALLILIFAAAPRVGLASEERRVALVMGNGSYRHVTALNNAVNDANDVAEALEKLGFTVIRKIDADRAGMREGVRDFALQIKRGGVGLFFYAGHGLQVDGDNYLVPVDAELQQKFEIEDQCLKVNYVLAAMEEAQNELNIIILDACRNNPFRSFRGVGQGLAYMDAPTGSIIAFATAPGSVASDGTGRNGLYTSKLLKHIATPGLRLLDVFNYVGHDVMAVSNQAQVPWVNHTPLKPFYFVEKTVAEPAPAPKKADPLADEWAKLEAEKKRIEEEKRLIEEQRKLAEERTRLETERKAVELKSQQMASLPQAAPPRPEATADKDKQSIIELLQKFQDTTNNLDENGLLSVFSDNASIMTRTNNGVVIMKKEKFAELMPFKMAHQVRQNRHMEFGDPLDITIKEDTASVQIPLTVTLGREPETLNFIFTFEMIRDGSGWLIKKQRFKQQ